MLPLFNVQVTTSAGGMNPLQFGPLRRDSAEDLVLLLAKEMYNVSGVQITIREQQ